MVVHSEAPRLLTSTPYADRRAECERAAHIVGPAPRRLRARRPQRAPDPVLRRRARHVITECARVREAERLLARGNLVGLGAVMTEGHRSLAGDYRVSVPAVDELVEHLARTAGCPRCPDDRRRLRRLRDRAVPSPTRPPWPPRPTPRAGAGGSARLPAQRFSRRSDQRIEHPGGPAAVDRRRRPAPRRSCEVVDASGHHQRGRCVEDPDVTRGPRSPSSTERMTPALRRIPSTQVVHRRRGEAQMRPGRSALGAPRSPPCRRRGSPARSTATVTLSSSRPSSA